MKNGTFDFGKPECSEFQVEPLNCRTYIKDTSTKYKCKDNDPLKVWNAFSEFNFTCEYNEYLYKFFPLVDTDYNSGNISYAYQCCLRNHNDNLNYSNPVKFLKKYITVPNPGPIDLQNCDNFPDNPDKVLENKSFNTVKCPNNKGIIAAT